MTLRQSPEPTQTAKVPKKAVQVREKHYDNGHAAHELWQQFTGRAGSFFGGVDSDAGWVVEKFAFTLGWQKLTPP